MFYILTEVALIYNEHVREYFLLLKIVFLDLHCVYVCVCVVHHQEADETMETNDCQDEYITKDP